MIAFALFNNKGRVGKTTLTYHLAHMMQRLGHRVLVVDLDPQSNLTAAFLDEDTLEDLWREDEEPSWKAPSEPAPTIAAAIQPILDGTGDVEFFEPHQIIDGLWLVPGDLKLSGFEDRLSDAWPRGLAGNDQAALRTTTAFHRVIRHAASCVDAEIVMIDVGPNLGAINRAAVLAADAVVMPLTADLLTLRGLRNLGPTLHRWRATWQHEVLPRISSDIPAPLGTMTPIGYVIMRPSVRLDRRPQAYWRWLEQIPAIFYSAVLGEEEFDPDDRSYEIATMQNYHSLAPLSHDARKPMFDLRAADGALGSTQTYVQKCYQDFKELSEKLLIRLNEVPHQE